MVNHSSHKSSRQFHSADQEEYVRERISPKPGDIFYLHLSDLLIALQEHATDSSIRILDYGCGCSPYESLFPNAEYLRADIQGTPNINYEISSSGTVNAPSQSFDLVLSTQVLEHCPDTAVYLGECKRVLAPGGKLLLSTHGLFEEHGFPHDYYRWTEDGLRQVLSNSGFRVKSITRLTLGPRAGMLLMQRAVTMVRTPQNSNLIRYSWGVLRRLLLAQRHLWHPLLDKGFPEYRKSDDRQLPSSSFYIALIVNAES